MDLMDLVSLQGLMDFCQDVVSWAWFHIHPCFHLISTD